MKKLKTPYYLIDESILLDNLQKIEYLRKMSGVKVLLATKCFATWSVFPLIKKYVDGSTSSSPFEVKLGYQKIGKETHAYSVGYSPEDIKFVNKYADKIIFNSVSQLKNLCHNIPPHKIALRINTGVSYYKFKLADPVSLHSRLGESSHDLVRQVIPYIQGLMFHFNCENDNLDNLIENIRHIEYTNREIIDKVKWISLGGGIAFTSYGYPIERFAKFLREFSLKHHVQVYLEPGEAIITGCAELVTTIVDITTNGLDTAIIDASTEAHIPDLLIYHIPAMIPDVNKEGYSCRHIIAGRSCLAGDVFGTYYFEKPLSIGQEIRIQDAAGYSIVKKNWFNGLQMPSIVVKRLSGKIDVIRKFGFSEYKKSLS